MRTAAAISIVLLGLLAARGEAQETFSWSSDRQQAQLSEGKEHTILSGHATITSGSTTITAQQIELYGKDFRYAVCTGNVQVADKDRGINLQTQKLFYDRIDEVTRVNGYMEMEDIKNQVVVKGGYLEYNGKDEIAVIQIGVRILKVTKDSEIACRSEFARYLRNSNTLELSGLPVVDRNSDEYSAARIVVDLDTEEITLDQGVSGKITEQGSSPSQPESGGSAGGSGQTDSGSSQGASAQPGNAGAAAGSTQSGGTDGTAETDKPQTTTNSGN